jgi:SH3-like domain-containing protein
MQVTLLRHSITIGVIASLMSFGTVSAQESGIKSGTKTETEQQTLQAAPSLPLRIIAEPVPTYRNQDFLRKTANETPSGYKVPRYVSLKFGKTNGRTGPSRDHAIAWQYRRRGLPLIVVAETENWRKVSAVNGDESWVRKSGLSGERFVITTAETRLLAKPKSDARAVATSEAGALMKLEDCNEEGWCRVKAGNGLRGWAAHQNLWGAQKL